MAHPTPRPDTSDGTDAGSDRGSPPGAPRWVKVFGITLLILVLLMTIMMLTGVGGQHGPGRHLHSGGAGGQILPVALRMLRS